MEYTGDRDPAEGRGRRRKAGPWPVGSRWAALVERLVTEAPARLVRIAIEMVRVLRPAVSRRNLDRRILDRRGALKAIYALSVLAQKGKCVDKMVEKGVIPALVKHLQAPPPSREGDKCKKFLKHVVEQASARALTLLAAKPEHRQLIVNSGALFHLLNLLKRHKAGSSSRPVHGLILSAARAILELVRGDSSAGILVRMGGGILLLAELLDADSRYVRRAAAVVLHSLAWENKETGNQIVDCGAFPSIVPILKPDSADIHFNAVYPSEQYVNNAMPPDVIFLVESRQIYAHRTCLSTSSDTFRAMLDGGFQEKGATSIEIPNIRCQIFELMMRFMYSGSVEIEPDIAPELLRAADQYQIEGLKRLCERALVQEISEENVSTMYEVSKDFNATSLRHSCILFILEHFDEFRHWYFHLLQEIVSAIRDYFSVSVN